MDNYQKMLDRIIEENQAKNLIPSLLLHSCCGPCSSYVLEYLSQYFKITVYYYNPNIYPIEEYNHRKEEQKRLISEMHTVNPIDFVEGDTDASEFYAKAKGLEHEPECGARCEICYEQRLRGTAQLAQVMKADYFTTTLTISPLKDAEKINIIGQRLAEIYGVAFLPSDFKKKGGYQRSIQLSKEHNLYRQNYCGCVFSIRKTNEL